MLEALVTIVIIGILSSIAALSVRGLTDRSVLAQAHNAVLTFAQVARSYAVVNHIETMLVVNPKNGRFEIWHLNPPVDGGSWDPHSSGTAANQPQDTDGYAFAPVLDASARLPVNGNDEPTAFVAPIDFESRPYTVNVEPNMDNLRWAAFCFDEHGQLVIRTRRFATRTILAYDGSLRTNPNRLVDATPNLSLLANGPLVIGGVGGDTPVTSACGFVISDFARMKTVFDVTTVTPQELVQKWLIQTRPGGRYAHFADTVVLNRFSGDQSAKDK